MKTERYIPRVRDIFWARQTANGLLAGFCAPFKCIKQHFVGKSLVTIEARGWSTEFGGTPWTFRLDTWNFEKDGNEISHAE